MQHPLDHDHKSQILALLDRARVNCGLQLDEKSVTSVCEQDKDDIVPAMKIEVTEAALPQTSHVRSALDVQASQCMCGHTMPLDSIAPTCSSLQGLPAAESKFLDVDKISMINVGRNTAKEAPGKSEIIADQQLLSSASMRCLDHLKDNTREQAVPRLHQLIPLESPRNAPTHDLQLESDEKLREMPPSKHLRKQASSTCSVKVLTKLALLTPDEYEDSELHGDFVHMLHILIPSNATTALLEHRGLPIQSISQQTKCTLSIRKPEASPFKDDRVLRIHGKAKGISLAQRLVIACIRAFRAEKGDPIYMDLLLKAPPVALPATSITKAMSAAVTCGKKHEVEITNPFSWMVQCDKVGKMMGRQGRVLESIRRDTGASIHVEENVVPGTTTRRVTLSGCVESIAAAIQEIKSRSGGHPEVAVSVVNARLGQYYAIPSHAAGCLIGPQGSIVKNIRERTGARLQLPSPEDLPLGSINRIVHVQGTPKQAEHARRVMSAKLRDYLASLKCSNPSSSGRKGDVVTIKALLPSRICGFLLNHRGKLIREISTKSGAHTHFLAAHDDGKRVCVFTGDMSCVLRAQRLVLQVIAGDAISSKRAGPSRKRKRVQRDHEVDEEDDDGRDDKYRTAEEVGDEDDVEEDSSYRDDHDYKDNEDCVYEARPDRKVEMIASISNGREGRSRMSRSRDVSTRRGNSQGIGENGRVSIKCGRGNGNKRRR